MPEDTSAQPVRTRELCSRGFERVDRKCCAPSGFCIIPGPANEPCGGNRRRRLALFSPVWPFGIFRAQVLYCCQDFSGLKGLASRRVVRYDVSSFAEVSE